MELNNNTINIRGKLVSFEKPIIMGILNCTPDSFYSKSRVIDENEVEPKIKALINDGANWIDIGGYSSRPGAKDISEELEIERLKPALEVIASEYSSIPVSIDTFNSKVAEWAVSNYNIDIINDISGGHLDPHILDVAGEAGKVYIGMHMRGTPQNMQNKIDYSNLLKEIKLYFSKLEDTCNRLGINDLIIDPGFGFSKTLEQNYELLNRFDELSIFKRPLLAGLSRKSMIYKHLNTSPEDSLTGTIALNTIAIIKGASVLRVHDVKQAVETVELVCKTINTEI